MADPPKKTPTGDYPVGYCSPPKSAQFRKGQKRPPRNAKKAEVPDLSAFLAEELNRLVDVPGARGRFERLPVGRLMIRQMVNKAAASGGLRQIWAMLPKVNDATADPYSALDAGQIAAFLARYLPPGTAGEGVGDSENDRNSRGESGQDDDDDVDGDPA